MSASNDFWNFRGNPLENQAESRCPLKLKAWLAVQLNKVVNRFDLNALDEDSQTGFCCDSPAPLKESAKAHSHPAIPGLPRSAHLSRHQAGVFGFAAALVFSLVAQESHTKGADSVAGADSAETTSSEHTSQRWRRSNVSVALDESLAVLGPDIERIIAHSFVTWENTGAALPSVEFVQTTGAVASLMPDGQSTILVAPIEFPGHETDLAITIGFSNPQTGEVSEADIVINSKHVFSSVARSETLQSGKLTASGAAPDDQESCTGSLDSSACGQSYDLANVLTHEVGHFFGLGENYNEPRATMFSCTSACEIHKRDLEPADMDSIILLYVEQPLETPVGCSGVKVAASPTPQRFGLWGGWLALLGASVWRRQRSRPRAQVTH